MTCSGYGRLNVEIAIMLLRGHQWQWRAGKENPQAPGIMGGQAQAPTQSDRATEDPRIQYRLFRIPAPRSFPPSAWRDR